MSRVVPAAVVNISTSVPFFCFFVSCAQELFFFLGGLKFDATQPLPLGWGDLMARLFLTVLRRFVAVDT